MEKQKVRLRIAANKFAAGSNHQIQTLYACLMGWPGQKPSVIRALANNSPQLQGQKITQVTLLGHQGKLDWQQDENGLTVTMPPKPPCEHAFALKISGLKLS
jgi:alpha-L-fucosidase